MSIEFPLINKRTSFGIIPDSLIPVEILTKFGYQTLQFILVKIGQVETKVRCLFCERESTPYILGRADVFSAFNIVFDNQNKKIKFLKIK